MLAKLRAIWVDHTDEMPRMLLNEIARLHGVLRQVDQLSATVASVWLQERGGTLSALHQPNLLLEQEPAVMEQKARRSGRGVAPRPSKLDIDDDDDGYLPIELDEPS
ncbi:hypothetical protein [Pigmentiphaga litoralis]|uniref:Uncharacterized protein n=1 Tax=Pigmentiphaga litoralis TaxID=516702 RepID=A0A7Y9IZH6_9BURK|nr:hypothetical protein [Pigmentiphaga litoralis]NYE26118.1 hypothetical protein [Pigmentiphaga litoralis]NYE85238.1 hypothetical protein [Pigmentiphaga litoralis]